MDDNNNNIFEVLDSSSPTKTLKITSTSTSVFTRRRSHLPSNKTGNGLYSASTSSTTKPSTPKVRKRNRRKDRALQDLGFVNPGPKNLVNVATVPARRLKSRQTTAQEKPSLSKPLYDQSGLLVSGQIDQCDCNHVTCPGCFLPCTSCHSSKCGLECRNLRTYTYEYRLYGTNIEITQHQ